MTLHLFEENSADKNLLPFNGEAFYFKQLFSISESQHFLDKLTTEIAWEHDEIFMFGKKIITKRKVAWYGDSPFDYTYSNSTKTAIPWNKELTILKNLAEEKFKTRFNSCLLNYYHNGEEGMSWHADNETTLVQNAPIASFSFGAERKFAFKHRETKDKISLYLENGSLLLMQGEIQRFWLHALPKTKKVQSPRINLTFRQMKLK
jgi:alkylated DNA repair dioxygenase AlkB